MLNDKFFSRLQTAVLSLRATSKKITTIPDEAGQNYDDIRPVVPYFRVPYGGRHQKCCTRTSLVAALMLFESIHLVIDPLMSLVRSTNATTCEPCESDK